MLQIDLSKFLTKEAIQKTFETLPPLMTPVMDKFYPEAKRRTHPFPFVSVNDIQTPVKNIAVVKRGGNPTPIYGKNQSITMIEVQPLKPSERVNAVDVNNLRLLNASAQIQNYVDQKIDRLRRSVRNSTEALAAQSLTGSISYPMEVSPGVYGTYQVDYTSVLTQTISKLWTASDITIADVLGDFINIVNKIKKESQYGGGGVTFWAGTTAFQALATIIMALPNDQRGVSNVNGMSINFFGHNVELASDEYVSNVSTGATTPVVAANKIMAVANNAPFELIYASLDNIEANLAALPIWIKQIVDKRNDSIELIAESKPLPVPYTKGICWATVTA
jgi:hypothetical protein